MLQNYARIIAASLLGSEHINPHQRIDQYHINRHIHFHYYNASTITTSIITTSIIDIDIKHQMNKVDDVQFLDMNFVLYGAPYYDHRQYSRLLVLYMESEENQEIRLLNLLKPIPVPTSRDISMLDQLKALRLVISKTMLFRTMYIIISLCRDFLVLQFSKR